MSGKTPPSLLCLSRLNQFKLRYPNRTSKGGLICNFLGNLSETQVSKINDSVQYRINTPLLADNKMPLSTSFLNSELFSQNSNPQVFNIDCMAAVLTAS
jgi:hypothetical protein